MIASTNKRSQKQLLKDDIFQISLASFAVFIKLTNSSFTSFEFLHNQ